MTDAFDEIAEKQRWWTTETVNARLRGAFSGPDGRRAAALLARVVGEVPDGEDEASDIATCRLMLAALKVSGGDLMRLALWVEAARVDPLDLIAAAEYRWELGDGRDGGAHASRVALRHADLAGYVLWCVGEQRADADPV